MSAGLKDAIDAAFEQRQGVKPGQGGDIAEAVEQALMLLDSGQARVAQKVDGSWIVNDWLKKAILLSFRLNENRLMGGSEPGPWWDKVTPKFSGWTAEAFGRPASAPCQERSCGDQPILLQALS